MNPYPTCRVPLEQYVVNTHMLGESIQAPMKVVMFSCAISRLYRATRKLEDERGSNSEITYISIMEMFVILLFHFLSRPIVYNTVFT